MNTLIIKHRLCGSQISRLVGKLIVANGATFAWGDFRGLRLSRASFRNSKFPFADFERSDLSYADLRSADLRNANLAFADLQSADLRGAQLRNAVLRGANLHAVTIEHRFIETAFVDFVDIIERYSLWKDLPWLLNQLVTGQVCGSLLRGRCVGIIGMAVKCTPLAEPGRVFAIADAIGRPVNWSNPCEKFFLNIDLGHTPETNEFSRIATDWCRQLM